ncbi:type II toxin-antitoxin system RelE/ParE family toxin [Dickeya undicola]|uniref:type II toxin-antitoxin system RelE/ParE family toxin n=1 Tax=Dickeya undicola TaxID=1577887 RepID=UPI000532C060|nr:type II toxin-antitoxin system RelE/ParE family toxin [Dickeya undicola]
MRYEIDWAENAVEDVAGLFEYLAENASIWDANYVTERILNSTDKLADFPRLYELDERYGIGVRRISQLGQHVLYEVDDTKQRVTILAVVGQRQNPRSIR